MANVTTGKQNKVLLIALVVILSAAAILIAVTGSANRKKEENPPLDNKETETVEDTTPAEPSEDAFGKKAETSAEPSLKDSDVPGKAEKTDKPAKETKPVETTKPADKTTSVDETEAAPVSAKPANELPRFIIPVNGTLIKPHSVDVPVFSSTMNDYRTHTGVDITCAVGAAVVSPADGVVGQVWEDPLMGISVNLIHAGGAVTTFKGLAPETMNALSAGTEVKAGQVIATAGDTALIECGDEPHVHLELTINGTPADPAEYIPFQEVYEG